jgi:hypothetical protein
MGLLGAAGKVAAATSTFLASRLMEAHPWLPLVMSALLLAGGTAAMAALPESAGRLLEDVVGGGAGECVGRPRQ